MALTDLKLRNLPLPAKGQVCYWDTLPGFGIRVSQGGARTFLLKHKNRFITLGRYHPDIFPLAKARDEAKRILAEFTLGKVRPQSITYDQAVKLFIEDKKRAKRTSTAEGYEWLLNRLGLRGQLADITHGEISRGLNTIKSRSTYDHALVAARIFFNWCLKRRYISENPTFGLSPHGTPKRARTLTTDELRAIWQACNDSDNDLPQHYRDIVKLLVLTGQRRGEVAALRGDYFKDDLCTLPPTLTKNGRLHQFPIGSLAYSVLSSYLLQSSTPQQLLFPARGKSAQPFNGWSKAKAQLDQLSGVTDWTLHDIRRTYATTLAKLGTPIHVVEKLLNHVSGTVGGIVAVYQRHQWWDEQIAAVTAYENHLKTALDIA